MGLASACALHASADRSLNPSYALRTTPAMVAGVTSWLWEIGDIVDVLETWEAAQKQ